MNIKYYLESFLSADVAEFYGKEENASRLTSLQKAVVIFNSNLSEEDKNKGYCELIAEGEDDVIKGIELYIPSFAMPRACESARKAFPTKDARGQKIFDFGNGEVYDLERRAHIFKGWSSLLEYLTLTVGGNMPNSKRLGLNSVALNLFLTNEDGTYDFVWKNGEMLQYENSKFIVYQFSSYPNGAIKYCCIQVFPNGKCRSNSSLNSMPDSKIYCDNEIYHASRINESELQGKEIFLIELSKFLAKNPQSDPESLCSLLDAYWEK